MAFTVVYDANVLYPAPLRDLLLQLALAGEFRARYTSEILDEVFRNLAERRNDIDPAQLARTRALMETVVPDVLVTGHMPLVDALDLPDDDDRHVLAAAIRAGADLIVTNNLADFPPESLAAWDVEAQSADVFAHHLVDLYPGMVLSGVHTISARLSNPPQTPRQVVDTLERLGLVQTAVSLRLML